MSGELAFGATPAVPVTELKRRAQAIRKEVVRLSAIAGSGHYGSAFSCIEILVALYDGALMRLRADEPIGPERDRFLLGKGHAAIALYPVLADLGFFDAELLDIYTRLGSRFGDLPDVRKVPGCDFSSGSIGHNLSVSVGMALHLTRRGSPGRVVCLMGDGEQPRVRFGRRPQRRALRSSNLIGSSIATLWV